MGAGQGQIEQAGGDGGEGRDLLYGPAQGGAFRGGQGGSHGGKDQAHDDADMQAGDGEQVGQAAGLEGGAVRGGNGGA